MSGEGECHGWLRERYARGWRTQHSIPAASATKPAKPRVQWQIYRSLLESEIACLEMHFLVLSIGNVVSDVVVIF